MSRPFTIKDILDSPAGKLNPHLTGKQVGVPTGQPQQKYGNKKTEYDGYTFDSKKECVRYRTLRVMEITGEIQNLKLQVSFDLPGCRYVADFVYDRGNEHVIEDVKSAATRKNRVYRLKNKLMFEVLGIKINEV